jgi:hypothetical protein
MKKELNLLDHIQDTDESVEQNLYLPNYDLLQKHVKLMPK